MRRVLLTLMAAAGLALLAAPASAAPQILQIVSTGGAKQLECAGGVCRAEFTSLCMQKERPVPLSGMAYGLVTGAPVVVTVTGRDGAVRRIAAENLPLRISTYRRYSAVEIGLGESALAALDAVAVAVEIEGGAYLVPVPEAGDPDPITTAEIARVTGHDPVLAEWLDGDRLAEVASLRTLSELIGALPVAEVVSAETREALAEALEARYAAADARVRAGVRDALSTLSACDMDIFRKAYGAIRQCLQYRHDKQAMALNTDYWNRIQPKPDG